MEKRIMEHTFFDELFREKINIIDLGACKGEFSFHLNEMYDVNKIVMVEAGPENFKSLPHLDKVRIYNRVISSKPNTDYNFYEDPNSPYNGSVMFNKFTHVTHVIKSITLEEIFYENNFDFVDIIKIDVEGAEYDLLSNTPDFVFDKVRQITVEFHEFLDSSLRKETDLIKKRMQKLGFEFVSNNLHSFENYDVVFYKK
jgi:FkbM family methyltransferase